MSTPKQRFAELVNGMSREEVQAFAKRINEATPEQQARAMVSAGPEAEEWGRKFEDMGEAGK